MTVWFSLAAPSLLHAQTPPLNQLVPDSPVAQTPSASMADQVPDTPLPNKVLGQVPFTAKYTVKGEITDNLQHLFTFHSPYSVIAPTQARTACSRAAKRNSPTPIRCTSGRARRPGLKRM